MVLCLYVGRLYVHTLARQEVPEHPLLAQFFFRVNDFFHYHDS